MTAPWTETTLPTILSRYLPENIFNVDKFGLFLQCLSNKTLHLKGEKCSNGKPSKVCLIGLAAENVYDERLPMFLIERQKTHDVSKALKICLVNTVLNTKA